MSLLTSSVNPLRKILDYYPNVKLLARRLVSAVPLSVRLGRRFWKWYAFFEESSSWNSAIMEEFQLNRLRLLLSELVETSSFYRARLGDIDIHAINSLDEFRQKVPCLSRSEYRESYDQILNASWRTRKVIRSSTSGTTGNALQFYHWADDQPREWAAICHQWKRVGYHPGYSRRVEFRGLTPPGKLVAFIPEQNMMRCSILNFKRDALLLYAKEISAFRGQYYHGYPSALYLLASQILAEGVVFPQPKGILLASEMVFEHQIAKIMEAFPGAKVFAHYGCAERTVLAAWCEFRREYHVLPQYSLVEVDDKNGEIIGTNLYNTVNGFVRYRMKDAALGVEAKPCPDCHRPYIPRFAQLAGRSEDYLFSPEKGWIPPAIVTYPLKSLRAIQEVQFCQKDRTTICVYYTVLHGMDYLLEEDLTRIRQGLTHLFGRSMEFKFQRVDDFERGPTGKFKWIVSELGEAAHL